MKFLRLKEEAEKRAGRLWKGPAFLLIVSAIVLGASIALIAPAQSTWAREGKRIPTGENPRCLHRAKKVVPRFRKVQLQSQKQQVCLQLDKESW